MLQKKCWNQCMILYELTNRGLHLFCAATDSEPALTYWERNTWYVKFHAGNKNEKGNKAKLTYNDRSPVGDATIDNNLGIIVTDGETPSKFNLE